VTVWVTVLVLVLVLVLMLVLTLGSVVVVVCSVVVGSAVVVAVVVVGVVTDVVVRVIGVSVVGGVSDDVPPVRSLTRPKMTNAISTAPSAPNATSATGAIPGERFSWRRARWRTRRPPGRRTVVAVVGVGGRLVVGVVRVVRRSVARHGHR
jgi:hypothetical protein